MKRQMGDRLMAFGRDEIDRISALPEHMIHHIVLCLSTKDATRTSVLSKRFRSAWTSIPVLDFDSEYCDKWITDTGKYDFLKYMHDCIQRRAATDIFLKKFRLHYGGILKKPVDSIEEAITYAIEKKVEELDLRFGNNLSYIYTLQSDVFMADSVKIMKLQGLNLVDVEHMNMPSLEELNLKYCEMGDTLTVLGNRLKIVELLHCEGLSNIDISSPSLTSFSYQLISFSDARQLDLKACTSLKNIILKRVGLKTEQFEEIVPEFLLLETLELNGCNHLDDITITNPNLKTLEIHNCTKLKTLLVVVENLKRFVYEAHRVDWNCDINIEQCKYLEVLEIYNGSIVDRWLEKTLSRLRSLQHLKLSACPLLVRLLVYHEALKHFELHQCNLLKKVEFHARSLTVFKYVGGGRQSKICLDSPGLAAHLKLFNGQPPTTPYKKLRKFLGCFDHCKSLTIAVGSIKYLIFPDDLTENLLPPLYDIKHLTLETKTPLEKLTEFVDTLLWLCPLLETVTFTTEEEIKKYIRLEYTKPRAAFGEEDNIPEDEDLFCCGRRMVKCWRHFVNKVSIENFMGTEQENLKKYFIEGAFRLESVTATGPTKEANLLLFDI